MTDLATAMYDHLTSVMPVGTNVFPWRLPKKGELPAITYQMLPGPGPLLTHDDAHSAAPVESLFLRRRMQWDIWAPSYLELELLTTEFRHQMHAFQGDMGGLYIGSIFLDVEIDSYEEDINVYRRIYDGMVRYNEIIAAGS